MTLKALDSVAIRVGAAGVVGFVLVAAADGRGERVTFCLFCFGVLAVFLVFDFRILFGGSSFFSTFSTGSMFFGSIVSFVLFLVDFSTSAEAVGASESAGSGNNKSAIKTIKSSVSTPLPTTTHFIHAGRLGFV